MLTNRDTPRRCVEPGPICRRIGATPFLAEATDGQPGEQPHTIVKSRLRFEDGKMYLLRVVVDEDERPPVIITAYQTSKIEKYWSAE